MITIKCPIKCIKTFKITTVEECDESKPVSFPGCTPTINLKDNYTDSTKVMTLTGTITGDDDNELNFTTTVAGTTVTPGRYKGDITITNGTTIVNRDLKLDWIFEPIAGD